MEVSWARLPSAVIAYCCCRTQLPVKNTGHAHGLQTSKAGSIPLKTSDLNLRRTTLSFHRKLPSYLHPYRHESYRTYCTAASYIAIRHSLAAPLSMSKKSVTEHTTCSSPGKIGPSKSSSLESSKSSPSRPFPLLDPHQGPYENEPVDQIGLVPEAVAMSTFQSPPLVAGYDEISSMTYCEPTIDTLPSDEERRSIFCWCCLKSSKPFTPISLPPHGRSGCYSSTTLEIGSKALPSYEVPSTRILRQLERNYRAYCGNLTSSGGRLKKNTLGNGVVTQLAGEGGMVQRDSTRVRATITRFMQDS